MTDRGIVSLHERLPLQRSVPVQCRLRFLRSEDTPILHPSVIAARNITRIGAGDTSELQRVGIGVRSQSDRDCFSRLNRRRHRDPRVVMPRRFAALPVPQPEVSIIIHCSIRSFLLIQYVIAHLLFHSILILCLL